jgi:hypothetical protein
MLHLRKDLFSVRVGAFGDLAFERLTFGCKEYLVWVFHHLLLDSVIQTALASAVVLV